MQRLPLMFLLAGIILILSVAGSAQAQCFDCVQESGSNPAAPNLYCRPGGNDFSACTTGSVTDPVTCVSHTTCNNTYACTTDPGGDGGYCSNSSCDSNQKWEIQTMRDMNDWYCYHYNTTCNLWR